jgi:hypothetical protein
MNKFIACDLDHTVTDAGWRDHLLKTSCPYDYNGHLDMTDDDWHQYHRQCCYDPPRIDVIALVQSMTCQISKPLVLTSRPESVRAQTQTWLKQHQFHHEFLLMRPLGDKRSSPVLKKALLESVFGADWPKRISVALDDHPGVVQMFREHHVLAIQINGRSR